MAIPETTAATATSLMGRGLTKQETENHMRYNGFSGQNISSKTPELNMWPGACLCVCVLLSYFPFYLFFLHSWAVSRFFYSSSVSVTHVPLVDFVTRGWWKKSWWWRYTGTHLNSSTTSHAWFSQEARQKKLFYDFFFLNFLGWSCSD